MKKTKLIEEICKMRFEDIFNKHLHKELTTAEAADLLGISERTFRRKKIRFQEEGFDGNFDRRIGKESGKKASKDEIKTITNLYENHYKGFSVKHMWFFGETSSPRETVDKHGIAQTMYISYGGPCSVS